MRYKYTKEELQAAVHASNSIAGVCRMLQMKAANGNYRGKNIGLPKRKLSE